LNWLEKYTFPRESDYQDTDYALHAYLRSVSRSLRCGTTTACYFATIHSNSSKILAECVEKIGQRAFIGKVSMDRNAPDYYKENSAETAIQDARDFAMSIINKNNPLITPILTPRFVPTCSWELMTGLSSLAKELHLPIQSHLSENLKEIEWVKNLHPEAENYTDVYYKTGLLTSRTIMAHGIYLDENEINLLKLSGTGISHCPNSNFSIQSGVLNVRRLLQQGIKVGLGTDVAGGYSPSILDSIRNAIIASKVVAMSPSIRLHQEGHEKDKEDKYLPLSLPEVFYLATLGGAYLLGLGDRIGNFEIGKEFDALLIDCSVNDSVPQFPHDNVKSMFEKFVYLGDDRNIVNVFVSGKQIPSME